MKTLVLPVEISIHESERWYTLIYQGKTLTKFRKDKNSLREVENWRRGFVSCLNRKS
jgi:hypothetical protein